MRYYGGKSRLASKLAQCMLSWLTSHNAQYDVFIDAFCGSGSVSASMRQIIPANIACIGSDYFKVSIDLLKALQEGWLPPETITAEIFCDLKNSRDKNQNPLVGAVGFHCSWSGKFFCDKFRPSTLEKLKQLRKKSKNFAPKLAGIKFEEKDYREYQDTKDCVFYLDPPYQSANKSSWPENFKGFNHTEFWQFSRELSKSNIVFISEATAPEDFESIADFGVTIANNKLGKTRIVSEKLWMFKKR